MNRHERRTMGQHKKTEALLNHFETTQRILAEVERRLSVLEEATGVHNNGNFVRSEKEIDKGCSTADDKSNQA